MGSMKPPSHRFVVELLAQADIQLDGRRPWDIQLKVPGVIDSALSRGNLGLGESYMRGSGTLNSWTNCFID
ncbi:hypothetical protein HSBAA_49960 [Vreelandella sulfidaeris]|uniref:Uncharacterized protein n=1 Tax=Vreelandella sulfidaeris TaxID=115553 RepID=A0A455UBT0_9GAMM|nr:hypothetical protein HSBAA_49960 [Halomonas sulfidaeris]